MTTVVFSSDGKQLASGREIWDVTGWQRGTFWQPSMKDPVVAFSPKGEQAAACGVNGIGLAWPKIGRAENPILVWDAKKRAARAMSKSPPGKIYSLAFSMDGHLLAASGTTTEARLWSVEDGSWVATLAGHESAVYCICFSPDGRLLATASGDETVKLWDVSKLAKQP